MQSAVIENISLCQCSPFWLRVVLKIETKLLLSRLATRIRERVPAWTAKGPYRTLRTGVIPLLPGLLPRRWAPDLLFYGLRTPPFAPFHVARADSLTQLKITA